MVPISYFRIICWFSASKPQFQPSTDQANTLLCFQMALSHNLKKQKPKKGFQGHFLTAPLLNDIVRGSGDGQILTLSETFWNWQNCLFVFKTEKFRRIVATWPIFTLVRSSGFLAIGAGFFLLSLYFATPSSTWKFSSEKGTFFHTSFLFAPSICFTPNKITLLSDRLGISRQIVENSLAFYRKPFFVCVRFAAFLCFLVFTYKYCFLLFIPLASSIVDSCLGFIGSFQPLFLAIIQTKKAVSIGFLLVYSRVVFSISSNFVLTFFSSVERKLLPSD